MLWLLLGTALAYETDNITERHLPLADATLALDDKVNEVIGDAIAWTNHQTACSADPDRAQELLATAIHERTAPDRLVPERGGFRALGFDEYSAWIETGGAPHHDLPPEQTLFSSVRLWESPVLNLAGTCSTVRIGDLRVGTDKLDHFFEEGYVAWQRADRGADPDRGTAWATRTERTIYGLQTSGAFSYADLKADHDGMLFYDTLLDPGMGVARIAPDGCLEPTRPFTWRLWVTWEYDEVLNPPVFTPPVQEAVTRHLRAHRDAYCASYSAWGDADYEAHLDEILAERPWYTAEPAPARTDPYELETLCEDWRPSERAALD